MNFRLCLCAVAVLSCASVAPSGAQSNSLQEWPVISPSTRSQYLTISQHPGAASIAPPLAVRGRRLLTRSVRQQPAVSVSPISRGWGSDSFVTGWGSASVTNGWSANATVRGIGRVPGLDADATITPVNPAVCDAEVVPGGASAGAFNFF